MSQADWEGSVLVGSRVPYSWGEAYLLESGGKIYQIVRVTNADKDAVWTIPSGSYVEYLLVGGGASGGYSEKSGDNVTNPGGGGAGGVILDSVQFDATTDVTVRIGAGGTSATSEDPIGHRGGDTILTYGGAERRRAPGGSGGHSNAAWQLPNEKSAGSAGGGYAYQKTGGVHTNGTGTAVGSIGNDGAVGSEKSYVGGGGGGAGGVDNASNGGAGTNLFITGSEVWYAAGGAAEYGVGGSGIGGQPARSSSGISAREAVPNTGSGGAAGAKARQESGAGASGVAVLRYEVKARPQHTATTGRVINRTRIQYPWGESYEVKEADGTYYQVVRVTATDTDVAWQIPADTCVEYLLVGGGASGGWSEKSGDNVTNPGGGGAGGVIYDFFTLGTSQNVTIRVGAGGTSATSEDPIGHRGGDTVLAYGGEERRRAPGGSGGHSNAKYMLPNENSAGSAGGGNACQGTRGVHTNGVGTAFGAIGNDGAIGPSSYVAGGGGGAGSAGGVGVSGGSDSAANGGAGTNLFITGSEVWYAAGGAAEYGVGGSGIGGHPARYDATHSTPAREAAPNTGSGGAAGAKARQESGAGASGVAVLRYPLDHGAPGMMIILR